MEHDDIRAALDAITPGRWEWHHEVSEGSEVVGYDGLRTWIESEFSDTYPEYEEDVLQWRKDAWIAVNPGDATLIENAPAWIRLLLDENARLQKVVEAAVDFYPYAHNIAKGLEGYQPSEYHAAKVMTNSVEKMAALAEAAKEYDVG